jgi:3-isopropylmalate dehydrogenase
MSALKIENSKHLSFVTSLPIERRDEDNDPHMISKTHNTNRPSKYNNSLLHTPNIYIKKKMVRFSLGAITLFLAGASAFSPQTVSRGPTSSALNAVSKKDSYSITLLPGDGIGPEITAATKVALTALCEKAGFSLDLKEALIGGAAIDAVNDPFPDESLKQCLESDSVLLACIGGYKWDNNPRELRPESGLLKMRKEMGLFANLRPAKVLPQLMDASTLKREIIEGVDIMCVRELTGDVYFGTPKGIDVIDGKFILFSKIIIF